MVKLSHERRYAAVALSSRMMTRMMIGVALSAIATGEAYAQAVPSTSDEAGIASADATSDTAATNSAVDASAPDSDTLAGEIVVTGSRIAGVAPVGSSIIALGRADMETSGALTNTQLIQQIPQVLNLGVSESSRGQQGGSFNATFVNSINLRGIGPYATLTLIDGHRAVPQGTAGYAVDPSLVPTLGLERVEVVADGASAIYGSDAIAGVVNLILRRNYEGLEVTARYGNGAQYDERNVGFVAGHRWDTGQFTLSYEYGYHSNVNGRDRDYFRGDLRDRGGSDFRSTFCNPGNIIVGGVTYPIPAGGVTAANRSALVPGAANKCEPLKIADLLPEQTYHSSVLTFDQEITDWLELTGSAFYSNRVGKNLGGSLTGTLTVPNTNPFFVAPPGLNPASVTVQYGYLGQFPQPWTRGATDAYQVTAGFDVKLPFSWNGNVSYTYGRAHESLDIYNNIYLPALNAALASSNPATALNPFGGTNSRSVLDNILIGKRHDIGTNKLDFLQVGLDGRLVTLPGGEVKAAFGYERQKMGIYLQIDANHTIYDETLFSSITSPHSRSIDSFYGEILIPVFGPQNAVPGLQALDIDLAIRRDSYNDVGSTTNPKVGINWEPVEGLTFHGSYGTSFRAPLLVQTYGTVRNISVANYSDPTCSCTIQGIQETGGNLAATPETARTYSFGFEYRPAFLSGLRLGATYFDIVYDNQVSNVSGNLSILGSEAIYAGTGIIIRNPSAAFIASRVAEFVAAGGVLTVQLPNPAPLYVDSRTKNLGGSITRGFDFNASYRFSTNGFGDFTIAGNGTYLTKYVVSVAPSAPKLDRLNNIFNPLRFRARGSVFWEYGPVGLSTFVNYTNSYTNNLSNPVHKVKSYVTADLHLALDLDEMGNGPLLSGSTIALDARNLFNRQPPFVNIIQAASGGGGFDPTNASTIGRVVSLQITKRFF